jgi:hypothetical protein
MSTRALSSHILADLKGKKMVMLSGPRQCGKTTLAKALPELSSDMAYYNWDVAPHREKLKNYKLDESKHYWVFDELHKYRAWRNWLKGVYDLHHTHHEILITGSARLDQYARGGDSLQGRYFHYRLHPFTLGEVLNLPEQNYRKSLERAAKVSWSAHAQNTLLELLKFGGFPEPFLSKSTSFAGRWRLAYSQRLVNEDVRTLEQTQELDQMSLLYDRLPDLVSNNLSINNLAKDLEISHQTVAKWIGIFEKLYANFYVLPYGEPAIKAIKKEKKLYLWDWARLSDPGARLENLVALHLLRLVHWFEDIYGEILELRYIKDIDGHEIDFLLLRNKLPWIAIEVKNSEQGISTGFKYLLNKIRIPYAYQIHLKSELVYKLANINQSTVYALPVSNFLCGLP